MAIKREKYKKKKYSKKKRTKKRKGNLRKSKRTRRKKRSRRKQKGGVVLKFRLTFFLPENVKDKDDMRVMYKIPLEPPEAFFRSQIYMKWNKSSFSDDVADDLINRTERLDAIISINTDDEGTPANIKDLQNYQTAPFPIIVGRADLPSEASTDDEGV